MWLSGYIAELGRFAVGLSVTEGTGATDHLSQDKLARIAGGFFLAFILASVLASTLGHIGLSDAEELYQTITTDAWLFRLGLVSALASALLFLLAAWGLYVLLRPIHQHLALLFLLLNAVGVAIQCASMLPLISALLQGRAGLGAAHQGCEGRRLRGRPAGLIRAFREVRQRGAGLPPRREQAVRVTRQSITGWCDTPMSDLPAAG